MILGVPTLCCYDLLDRLIESAERGSVKPTGYVIIDNGGSYRPQLSNVELVVPGRNLGVSASWNRILKLHEWEPVLISNDDVELGPETVELFMAALGTHPLATSTSGWDLFAQRPEVANRVGWYDEGFYPAYYEDNDYAYRCKLAGVERIIVESTYRHHGSSTIKKHSHPWEIQMAAVQCRERYIRKWGGVPEEEKFTVPFDGKAEE